MIDDIKEPKIKKPESEWQNQLTSEQYEIARCGGTECAFTGPYWDCKDSGTYHCICCNNPLFHADAKYDSGTGWPSFSQPASANAVTEILDESHSTRRTEVICSQCNAHLGHVFTDGPKPTGLRYCMNGTVLKLKLAKT